MSCIELALSEWLYNAVIATEVLTLSRDYFRLREGLERRLYELARKHCGLQAKFTIRLDTLLKVRCHVLDERISATDYAS